ncbi:hypothetical protein S245_030852, partial [Arachis hypogaea]
LNVSVSFQTFKTIWCNHHNSSCSTMDPNGTSVGTLPSVVAGELPNHVLVYVFPDHHTNQSETMWGRVYLPRQALDNNDPRMFELPYTVTLKSNSSGCCLGMISNFNRPILVFSPLPPQPGEPLIIKVVQGLYLKFRMIT